MRTSSRTIAVAAICMVLAVVAGLLLVSRTPSSVPQLKITYLGVMGNTGKIMARFAVSNCYSRDIGFAAGPVQFVDSNHAAYFDPHGLGAVYKVAAGTEMKFGMTLPAINPTQTWTVPIIYGLVPNKFDDWTDKVKETLHIPVGGTAWETNSPEVTGL